MNCKIMWDEKYKEAIETLGCSELSDSYDVYINASKDRVGCELLLDGEVIMYVSRK